MYMVRKSTQGHEKILSKKREHERGEKTNIRTIIEMKNKGQQINNKYAQTEIRISGQRYHKTFLV